MKCCLWFNGVKTWHARDIKNNFDLASLRGYFTGGSLLRWLEANGGTEEAKNLKETGNLEYTFGIIDEMPVGRGAPDAPKIHEPPLTIIGAPMASHPTSGSYNRDLSSFSSGSGSGSLGYGLHII
jgi:hypothetical protein